MSVIQKRAVREVVGAQRVNVPEVWIWCEIDNLLNDRADPGSRNNVAGKRSASATVGGAGHRVEDRQR